MFNRASQGGRPWQKPPPCPAKQENTPDPRQKRTSQPSQPGGDGRLPAGIRIRIG
ncbi:MULTISPECIES: hypothetical protein [Thermoactinomyces]|uniref:Uncharacterized protein n=1 Tax=Thermoactinomyces daqus TaxID=1329516 RepID=A0A7W2AHH9_9BACL|nr:MULTISPECIES: hypothetical protein [Thermoactinomyces]MBA4541858.1 hypothetical protein [Thermoactinomyces daqus]MBH8597855.1 hypothetical protein [Thermoactinomyces sp. CICC 10523]MBH8604207.1 hypothetical protein [Thermoactinomyces sp. CICC 10522]MBH8608071.1 hypothetical protein [Thermoactinomyces sp. CICC 10521]